MNKIIVLDLDGVIADIESSIENYITGTGTPDFVDYTDWLITDNSDKDALEMFNNKIFWEDMLPYKDAWHKVNEWFSEGVDVHIVTARRCDAAINATQAWLDKWKINTMIPHFSNINEKHNIIKDLNPQFVVEDNPNEVKILLDKGINTFLRKQWYNKKYWDLLPTVENLYDSELKIND
jgi:hypothetical protein